MANQHSALVLNIVETIMSETIVHRTITIELPETLTVGGPSGTERNFPTAEWNGDWILENALHGLKQRRSDKLSVTKDPAKLKELDEKIAKGLPLAGAGGGGGPQHSPETKGWIQFFGMIGHKEGGNKVNSKTLARAQETLCRRWLVEEGVSPEELTAAVAENIADFIAAMETEDEDLARAIENARKAAKPAKVASLKGKLKVKKAKAEAE